MGIPHYGSTLANWADHLTKITRLVPPTSRDIVAVFRPTSEMLHNTETSFLKILQGRAEAGPVGRIEVTSLCEELAMPVLGMVHVSNPELHCSFTSNLVRLFIELNSQTWSDSCLKVSSLKFCTYDSLARPKMFKVTSWSRVDALT